MAIHTTVADLEEKIDKNLHKKKVFLIVGILLLVIFTGTIIAISFWGSSIFGDAKRYIDEQMAIYGRYDEAKFAEIFAPKIALWIVCLTLSISILAAGVTLLILRSVVYSKSIARKRRLIEQIKNENK